MSVYGLAASSESNGLHDGIVFNLARQSFMWRRGCSAGVHNCKGALFVIAPTRYERRARRERAHHPPFRAADFFVLRTPLLPFDVLLNWSDRAMAPAGESCTEPSVADARRRLCSELKRIVARPEVQEALWLASGSLSGELARWLAGDTESPSIARALTRYLQRMTVRPTPFGLLAGQSVGRIGQTTRLELSGLSDYRRHVGLDAGYLYTLSEALGRDSAVRSALTYRPNPTLRRTGAGWRFVRTQGSSERHRHELVTVDSNEYVDACIEYASCGTKVERLVGSIASRACAADTGGGTPLTRDDAVADVLTLIDEQLLVSDLAPTVTGCELLQDWSEQIRDAPQLHELRVRLDRLGRRCDALSRAPVGSPLEPYQATERELAALGVPFESSRVFQAHLTKPVRSATLGPAVLGEILRGVELLQRLAPIETDEYLQRFRSRFLQRFGRCEVPIVEVFDEESGIDLEHDGGPDHEADGLPSDRSSEPEKAGATRRWTARDAGLLRRLEGVTTSDQYVLHLTPEDVTTLGHPEPAPLPLTFAVSAVLASRRREIDEDFEVFIRGTQGPSGANLLGRFCNVDEQLSRLVKQHLALEESLDPEAVYAEVVHPTGGRAANVLSRSNLRRSEIVYGGPRRPHGPEQIPITDLTVRIEGRRIVLRSMCLGREVVPRLTSTHDYALGCGMHRFICTLQGQGVASRLYWNWGALNAASFLPRVVSGRIVLSRARWRICRPLTDSFTAGSLAERFAALRAWRAERRVPRFAALLESESELPIDFENVLSVESLLHRLRTLSTADIVELFPQPECLCASGPEGRFVHEIVVPVSRNVVPSRAPLVAERRSSPRRDALRPPGSEWLYLKWYASEAGIDSILVRVLPELLRRLVAAGIVDRWFFVRYTDPERHLRLRLRGRPERLPEAILEAHSTVDQLVSDGRVWKVQIDTYERECDLYGGEQGVTLSEEWFWRDSEAALAILQILHDEPRETRELIGLRGIDMILGDLGFTLERRHQIARDLRDASRRQFGITEALRRDAANRFRRESEAIQSVFREVTAGPLAAAQRALFSRSAAVEPLTARLQGMEAAGQLSAPLASLAGRYVHLHVNRLFRSTDSRREFMLYDWLSRYYASQLARARQRASGEHVGG